MYVHTYINTYIYIYVDGINTTYFCFRICICIVDVYVYVSNLCACACVCAWVCAWVFAHIGRVGVGGGSTNAVRGPLGCSGRERDIHSGCIHVLEMCLQVWSNLDRWGWSHEQIPVSFCKLVRLLE